MISISATGRLAAQPELKMLPGGQQVCEFRLLDSRWHKGAAHVEAVTFFCFGEMAENFCSSTVKGQEISATGTQETQLYTPSDGRTVHYVKYRLSWFSRGRLPASEQRSQRQEGHSPNQEAGRQTAVHKSKDEHRGNQQASQAGPRGNEDDGYPSNLSGEVHGDGREFL